MAMTERQMIQEILNTVDVGYDFENVDEDNKQYTLLIKRQDNDVRDLNEINAEIKEYFKDADFSYDEQVEPKDIDADIRVEVKR
ncbi:hypothetical protein [Fructilactobacillus fructivorans]|uniref:Uncharacterized protein n=1 Tax=Fructilactobacillus fructivorans TaxID=1614 RepID=A0A0C1PK63_9LACO|nr:hypothetical protein [Fructilactobacillus fructivorans]KID41117.1 hypothetical protein LfDm3_1263 [Fructilactobacillus fructivorans]KRK57452.1 hypothetical protein FC73_GL000998 [Fructilactobacillus fructivorans]KRN12399.1 hypothetical protein IV37_GL001175 [Fructilactobacillus fructivorans]KRN42908.1 hypothetical protein IV48_GL000935 [Fructilactobacillus fructivorans]MCT0151487.1 hypothetical protein [Fructilactobacillus fructivorans]